MAALQGEDEGGWDDKTSRESSEREREIKCGSLDAVDPFVLLLCGRGRDPVKSVVSLDDAAVCFRLAGLDHLIFVVRDEELETVLGRSRTNKMSQEIYVNRSTTEKCKTKQKKQIRCFGEGGKNKKRIQEQIFKKKKYLWWERCCSRHVLKRKTKNHTFYFIKATNGYPRPHRPLTERETAEMVTYMTKCAVYRFLGVIDFSDTQILQWNYSSGFLILVNSRERK